MKHFPIDRPPSLKTISEQEAHEITRIWVSEKEMHVALASFGEDVEVWGIILADLGKHVANFYETSELSKQEILDRVKEMLDAEWYNPLGEATIYHEH